MYQTEVTRMIVKKIYDVISNVLSHEIRRKIITILGTKSPRSFTERIPQY